MLTKKKLQAIQLASETCHPNEAWDMLSELVDARFRQHKIRMLRNWEGNHRFDSQPFDKKIQEMRTQCNAVKMLMEEAKHQGLDIEINATIEVRLVNKPLSELNDVLKPNVSQN